MTLQVQVPTEAEDEKREKMEVSNREECEQGRLDVEEERATDGGLKADHEAMMGGNKIDYSVACEKMEVPDGGWGWVVAFSSAVIMMLIPIMGPCFGILFSRYLLQAGTSSTTTSWIFGLQTFLWNVSSLFTRSLSEEFGWRAVGIGGSLMASLGFIITSFTPAPEFLFFSFSILGGIGGGVATCLCFIVVPSYFTRRRGAANAVMTCGSGVGQIIVPPFTTYLQETYSDRGATLVFGGIMLHACVAAATFHCVEWHWKPRPVKTPHQETEEMRSKTSPKSPTLTKSSKPIILVRVAKSAVSDLGILRSKRACIICVSGCLIIVNMLNFMMIIPFAMQDIGLSLEVSAWCMSVMAVSSLVSRIICSLVSDLSFFSIRASYVAGSGIMAVASAVFPLLRSTGWLMANMVVYGIGMGANMAMYNLMMIEVMGLHHLAPVFGTSCFFNGLALVILGPLIGVIRDASQSYAVSIWVLSGIGICGTLLWTLMGRATKYDKERREDGRLDL